MQFAEIGKEILGIKNELYETLNKIEVKNEDIKLLQMRQNDLKMQIEFCENISSLSKEQSETVVQALSRRKYFDYMIGGIQEVH